MTENYPHVQYSSRRHFPIRNQTWNPYEGSKERLDGSRFNAGLVIHCVGEEDLKPQYREGHS
jgi:hypothetical protein